MSDLVCIGSLGFDTTRTPSGVVERVLGGSASYFAYSSGFFSKTNLVSAVGKDFPAEFKRLLESNGVRLCLEERGEKSFALDWSYDAALSERKVNSIEFNALDASWEPVVPLELRASKYVFAATLAPAQQLRFLNQFAGKKFSVVDSIEVYIKNDLDVFKKVLKSVDGVVLNESEARLLSGQSSLVKAGKAIQAMGPWLCVIKKGEHGSLLFYKDSVIAFPGFPLDEMVDPSGAGDSFAGGFMGYIAQKDSVEEKVVREAMCYAQVMGSFSVQGFGLDKLRKLSPSEVTARFNQYKAMLTH